MQSRATRVQKDFGYASSKANSADAKSRAAIGDGFVFLFFLSMEQIIGSLRRKRRPLTWDKMKGAGSNQPCKPLGDAINI
jgi:hypothetical protein